VLGFGATAWLPSLGKRKPDVGVDRTADPAFGREFAVVRLGASQVFEVGDDPTRRQACAEVWETLVAGGGNLIDTAPSHGTVFRA
jgi:hypothetical protein